MEMPLPCTVRGDRGTFLACPVPSCLHPEVQLGMRAGGIGGPCCAPHAPPRARRYPRRLVHLLSDLLHREPDAESDAVEDVLEVGLLIHVELGGHGHIRGDASPKCQPQECGEQGWGVLPPREPWGQRVWGGGHGLDVGLWPWAGCGTSVSSCPMLCAHVGSCISITSVGSLDHAGTPSPC